MWRVVPSMNGDMGMKRGYGDERKSRREIELAFGSLTIKAGLVAFSRCVHPHIPTSSPYLL